MCMVTVAIKNAFGSVRKTDIIKTLIKYKTPRKIIDFIYSYFTERKIIVVKNEYIDNNIGIPQGSSIGPILWLLIINGLLERCNDVKLLHIQLI